jgi:hypothetical protein
MNTATETPTNQKTLASVRKASGLTPRSLILGVLLTILVDFWIHWVELIMGGRQGHTALANTSIPFGAFSMMFALSGLNLLCRAILPSLAMSAAEVLVVYVMMTTSTVLSSSGQLQFIVPTVTAAWHYATPENGWAASWHRFVPHWMAQTDPVILHGFYAGKTTLPLLGWLPQIAAWGGFMLALAAASLCIVSLLRQQWVDRERLTFPTVALPLAVVDSNTALLRNRLFWLGAAGPFLVSCLNTLALNIPAVPLLNLRATGDSDIGKLLTTPPWNAIGYTPVSFYPFVVGIAYLIPTDVTFSCWFFFVVTRVERVVGSALNLGTGVTGVNQATFPALGHQGAGAFLALTLVSLWLSRSYLKEVWAKALGRKASIDDSQEPLTYRAALIGLGLAMCALVGFCWAAGMNPLVALVVIVLGLIYMIAATRIRAETGNAWLFGPDVDVSTLMTRTFGTSLLGAHDLTILAFLRPAIANFDLRCIAMPHQMDAFKMASEMRLPPRPLVLAIAVSTVIGLFASFLIALTLWHGFGAEGGTEPWRTAQGRVPFDNLVDILRNRTGPDKTGILALGIGFAVTTALMLLRTQFLWWPLHPVGYAIANTETMTATWLPFFLAWMFKSLALRYGGAGFYRKSVPFFLGLIAGDILGGGFFDALGAVTGINVYPVNW